MLEGRRADRGHRATSWCSTSALIFSTQVLDTCIQYLWLSIVEELQWRTWFSWLSGDPKMSLECLWRRDWFTVYSHFFWYFNNIKESFTSSSYCTDSKKISFFLSKPSPSFEMYVSIYCFEKLNITILKLRLHFYVFHSCARRQKTSNITYELCIVLRSPLSCHKVSMIVFHIILRSNEQ